MNERRADDLPLDLFIAAWNETQQQKTPALHRDMARWLNQRLIDGDRRLLIMGVSCLR